MTLARLHRRPRPWGLRRLAAGLCAAGLPLAALACTGPELASPVVARATADTEPATGRVQMLPPPVEANTPPAAPAQAAPAAHKPVPISLDTVLRLADDQNARVNVQREKVREAFAQSDVAAKAWLPDLWVGTSYYRHEGGIQDVDGTFFHSSFGSLFGGVEIDSQFDVREFAYQKVSAEQKVWQRREELSRLKSDTLLKAAETYIDLLAAYQAAAIIRAQDPDLQRLLGQARILAQDYGKRADMDRVLAEMANSKQLIDQLRAQAEAARAKLAYLLGIGPGCDLVPVDNRLGILTLVNPAEPLHDLVGEALTNGPGIREMEGLLGLIQQSIERAQGPGKYMPVIGLRVAEGVFGAGPGSSSDWDNRFDIILQARWNLTALASARDRQRVAQARINQANLTYDDLRQQLTAGVEEARSTSLENRVRFGDVETYLRNARDAVRQTYERLKDLPPEAKSVTDVLLAIRTQLDAQNAYLAAVRDYDKAQVRLLILTGRVGASEDGDHCGGH
jgi:outer membrane protein TolC